MNDQESTQKYLIVRPWVAIVSALALAVAIPMVLLLALLMSPNTSTERAILLPAATAAILLLFTFCIAVWTNDILRNRNKLLAEQFAWQQHAASLTKLQSQCMWVRLNGIYELEQVGQRHGSASKANVLRQLRAFARNPTPIDKNNDVTLEQSAVD